MLAASSLGARLRQVRDLADYNQQGIAEILGVAREVISYWENDRRVPSFAQLARLAEAYGVTTDSLLGTAPAPMAAEEHELVYRGLRAQPPRTKAGGQRWLAFLDEWTDLLIACGEPHSGRSLPPKPWRAADPLTDSRLAPRLAMQVREHYRLGTDAIPDLLAFLDRAGVLVYRVALDPIGAGEGVSGVTYHHPRLGACVLVNTNTTPGRQTFTLAHEFAHVLFHSQTRGLVSRADDSGRMERFADTFAAHFLVPSDALRQWVTHLSVGKVASPFDVIALHRFFRVSYATLLNRLRDERLLSPQDYEAYREYSPSQLAARLGHACDEYSPSGNLPTLTLGCYPTSVLDRVGRLTRSDALGPAAAADLLAVPLEEVLGELLATPPPANEAESREFAELPAVSSRRGRGGVTWREPPSQAGATAFTGEIRTVKLRLGRQVRPKTHWP